MSEEKQVVLTTIQDTTGNPAPLGLLGFGMTTVLLNLANAGLISLGSMIMAMGVFYGGIAQVIAGIEEWKKKNTFGATAFTSYGLFWLTLVGLIFFGKWGWITGQDTGGMVAYLIFWGIFTLVMYIGTLRLNKALQVVFFTLFVLFFLLAAGDATGSKDWHDWPYFAGDGAMQSEDGYYRILGRIDDVINVAGHRLGTKELESACIMVPEVAEAAVVPVVDEVKGRVPVVYIALKPGYENQGEQIAQKVVAMVEKEIGKIARPKNIYIVPDMPKTRSGKIIRRVLSAISNRFNIGDVTTLANADVVEKIRVLVQGKEKVAAEKAPEDLERFGEEK